MKISIPITHNNFGFSMFFWLTSLHISYTRETGQIYGRTRKTRNPAY